jgi:hypothetical protein
MSFAEMSFILPALSILNAFLTNLLIFENKCKTEGGL